MNRSASSNRPTQTVLWATAVACILLSGCPSKPPGGATNDKSNDNTSARSGGLDVAPNTRPQLARESSRSNGSAEVPRDEFEVGPRAAQPGANAVEEAAETASLPEHRTSTHSRPPATVPQPVYRPSDTRPELDDGQLARVGIHRYESKRLRLYTDIDAQLAGSLPPIADGAYDALVEYFGPLPPNREGTEFQVTGFIMADNELFRRAGLLPEDLPQFAHGLHRDAEFWMNDQPYDYYRRHLMIHELTHCFMLIMPGVQAPVWYLEGMAELFGCHRVEPDLEICFRVIPHSKQAFAGFGRIDMIRDAVAVGRLKSLSEVTALRPNDVSNNENYAWAWAVCALLDSHPRYRERFRSLSRHTRDGRFNARLGALFADDLAALRTEWALFAANLEYGYDAERAAITFKAGQPLPAGSGVGHFELAADRGWQSSGWKLKQGCQYEITASGRFTLGDAPEPWVSEPQGVSVLYANGQPLGRVLAAIRNDVSAGPRGRQSMLDVIPIGRLARFAAPGTGTLYLRVNDFGSSLADNRGYVQVTIRALAVEE